MTATILRRRKLGRTSTREIAAKMQSSSYVVRHWRDRMPAGTSIVFRWGCTAALGLPNGSFGASPMVVNTAESIHWCSDKKNGRLEMQAAGVPVPVTFGNVNEWARGRKEGMSYVLRPERHAQGRNLLVASRLGDMADFIEKFPSYYISELVAKVAEYRVFVCQNRAVWVAQKTPGNPEDVAWNVARGGRFDNVTWSNWNTKVLQAALDAAKVSGTDFCGVDVMMDAEGNPYVLEVNSAPSQTSPYRQSCVAKAFDYIIQNGKQPFDDVVWNPRKTWKSYIHPAVRAGNDTESTDRE